MSTWEWNERREAKEGRGALTEALFQDCSMIPPAIHSAQKRKKVTGGVSLPVTRRPGAGIMVSSDFRFP